MSTETAPVTVAPTTTATADPRADAAARRRRRWLLLFLGGWLAQVAVRLWFDLGQVMPVATPDETGYLFAARVMTGGPDADMSYGTVYRGGYALLLTPAFWISDDPVTVYRIALVVNALISAAMLPLAYVLLRRLQVTRRRSYLFAHVTALLPGTVFYAGFALTDAVLPVIVIGWLLLLHSWLTARDGGARATLCGAGAAFLAAYAYACHTRGVILLLVHVALVAAALAFRWRPWRALPVPGAVLAATAGAGTLLNRWLLPHLYPGGDNDLSGNLARRLTTQDGWGWMLSLGTGQLWYQAVATGGLAAVGLVAVAAAAVRRDTGGRLRALALGVLAIVAGIAFATSGALPDEYRIGNYVYGRYLACITPVLFAVGAAVLLRAPRRALLRASGAAAACTLLAAAVVQWYAGDRLRRYTFTPYDFPETSFLTWDWHAFRLWPATVAGLTLLGLALVATRLPRRGAVLLASLLAAVDLAMVATATERIAQPLVRDFSGYTELTGVKNLRSHTDLAVDWNVPWTIRLSHYYWAWWSDAEVFDARYYRPPARADLVVLNWPRDTAATSTWRGGAPAGWKIVDSRRTPQGDWVAWSRLQAP
ncbi:MULTISPECIES: hypothetical protein [Actinomadura]|uniref:4-amino-4-deoxy-L-arabinose transferase n=1 Tax=Actinomadura yumaensis TaxID=111807 RepID=A0ABW2CAI0_9ACTN|nr:hypothetical protein [Actinomadura sp. J1-007]MWK34042.1 hypothetical protein [Actinomadura sp. J1-007]